MPETTTQAVPSLSRARTCVAVSAARRLVTRIASRVKRAARASSDSIAHAWRAASFLRCRKRWLDWGIVFMKIEKVQKSWKKEYSKSINREKIEKKYIKSSLSGSPEVKSSLSGSSHIAVTIIRNLVFMANYSISANIFCLFAMSSQGKTQREEKRKKRKKTYRTWKNKQTKNPPKNNFQTTTQAVPSLS